ncbi:MAG TPA: hypothetical protein DHU63_06080 [Candidatus Marinimicrobia bacterium]|nr:MAG: hypothetical protein AUJ47_01170 [Candidatus Marinimicrobia bacterium CG1_02_48_14]HCW76091.1 hypothetical protein [Candidatus Neomarinimicrobiota bacterium]
MSDFSRPAWQEKQLRRVLKLSKLNGMSVMIFGILGGVIGVFSVSLEGILMGILIAGSGWVELEGRKKLMAGSPDASLWLMGGEALLLFVIVIYSVAHLLAVDPTNALNMLSPEMKSMISGSGGLPDQMVNELIYSAYQWLYRGLIIGTVLYQGGTIAYYYLKTRDL